MFYFYSFNCKLFTPSLSNYKLGKPVDHEDSMFQATFTPLDVPCIIRVTDLVNNDLEMLEKETDIDKLANHPNLIKILLSFIHSDGNLYTVFPHTPYPSMDVLCKPFGLSEPTIGFVLHDLLDAVDYLHKNNIVHRAIKGSHILMFGNLETSVKFVLTGLKYAYNMSINPEMQAYDYPSQAFKILNSLAPEVLEQNILGYNFKADIYSIGIVCCELANGIIPFDNIEPDEILFYKIIGDIPKPLDSSCEEMIIFQEYFDRLEITLKRRYQVYGKRMFSQSFHDFSSNCCLHIEPTKRLTACELLKHPFIQSIKKPQRIEIISTEMMPKISKT